MKRLLLRSPSFVRAARRMLKKHPEAAESFYQTLILLAEDAFHPRLRCYKLKGHL